MRIVEEAIADGVGLVRVANDAVPVGDRELAGDQDGGTFAPFLDDFDQVPAFSVAQRGQEPVVDGQQIGFGQTGQGLGCRSRRHGRPPVGARAEACGRRWR